MSKKILVALHPGFTNTPAIKRVAKLAQVEEIEIMLFSAVYDEYIPSLPVSNEEIQSMHDAILKSEQRKLEQIAGELEDVAKSVAVLAEWKKDIADSIDNMAKHFNADVIIVSSTRHSTMSRLMLSNTDWQILRRATKPVLFAHHQPERAYEKVMISVDPTHQHNEPAEMDNRIPGRLNSLVNGLIVNNIAVPPVAIRN